MKRKVIVAVLAMAPVEIRQFFSDMLSDKISKKEKVAKVKKYLLESNILGVIIGFVLNFLF